MDERRGGIEHLSSLGHIWLKYMSPVWGVIFIRQPDKPELHRQRFFVIQQDSITGVCPPLPSQSLLINTGIERMLRSNFSFYTPPLSFFPFSLRCVSLYHTEPGRCQGEENLINRSLKLRIIPVNSFFFVVNVAIFFSAFGHLYPWIAQFFIPNLKFVCYHWITR